MSTDTHDASESGAPVALESSESTTFYMWLLITVSAGIIMAQDSWVSLQQPRLGTVDATAAFTKVMVIHAIWLAVTIGFMIFTWLVRPTSAWRIHMVIGALTVVWTIGVLVWAFSDVERLNVSTWRCETAPTSNVATEDFLAGCERADIGSDIRLGGDIFLWSANDQQHWRWIVPGEGLSTLQTRWPSQVNAMYLSVDEPDAVLTSGAEDSVPGGNWSAGFTPSESRDLRIYFVEAAPVVPINNGTPDSHSITPIDTRLIFHERFKFFE